MLKLTSKGKFVLIFRRDDTVGVNLKGLTEPRTITLETLSGKIIALDAFNMLYQFLSSIRQYNGEPLTDERGNVVSHLLGILSRVSNLVDQGIKLVFVFDGKPHPLKEGTIASRRMVKQKALKEWKKALEEGDMKKARSKAQQTSRLTEEMVKECKHVFDLMGLPHVQALSDGEAQASHMAERDDIYATASQDYDCILFGAPRMVRNLTMSGRRKLPGRNSYVTVPIQTIDLGSMLTRLTLTRPQLVDMAILMGTDFNDGIRGVGPKTSLKLLRKYGGLERVMEEKGYEIPDYREVRKIFLEPRLTDDYELKWRRPRIGGLEEFYIGEHQFKEETIKKYLVKLERGVFRAQQQKLSFF